jgi:hypothetical protein
MPSSTTSPAIAAQENRRDSTFSRKSIKGALHSVAQKFKEYDQGNKVMWEGYLGLKPSSRKSSATGRA